MAEHVCACSCVCLAGAVRVGVPPWTAWDGWAGSRGPSGGFGAGERRTGAAVVEERAARVMNGMESIRDLLDGASGNTHGRENGMRWSPPPNEPPPAEREEPNP